MASLPRKADQTNALRGTSHDAQLFHRHANGDARLVDDHQVVLVCDVQDGNQLACFLCDSGGF